MQKLTDRNSLLNNPHFKASAAFKELQQTKLGFIDIGARGGVHDYVLPVAGLTSVLGFEPDEAECQRLCASKNAEQWAAFNMLPFALAEQATEKTLHLVSASTNHSLLPPNPVFVERYNMQKNWTLVGKEKMLAVTLDAVLHEQLPDYFADFIKIDTQGTEYEIILGGLATLAKQTTTMVCEVAFCELYQGQKLFSEVEMLLRENQFSFYGFMPIHTRSKKLLDKKNQVTTERAFYADAVFFKDPLSMPAIKLSQRQIYALFTTVILLGYYDYALELAMATWLKVADETEKQHIHSLIMELSTLDPAQTVDSLNKLMSEVKNNQPMANVLVGSFVDKRRAYCDYDDILNVSPLPASYDLMEKV